MIFSPLPYSALAEHILASPHLQLRQWNLKMMPKSQKIALKPNNKQATQFMKHCGYARIAFNAAHSEYIADNSLSLFDIKRRFNSKKREVFEWCDELSQNVPKNAMHDFGDALARYRSGQNAFPKKKRKAGKLSFRISNGRNSIKVESKRILLPKIGWVRMREALRWDGDIINCTISKRGDRWFTSMLIETNDRGAPDLRGLPPVGVDVGINSLAVTDDGTKYENPKALRSRLRKLRRLSKKLSRCQYLSNNWLKIKRRLARLHYRIWCLRQDAQHKASTDIVNRASVIGIESLNVKGLMQNRKLSRALADASLHSFLSMIRYKALRRGVEIIEADRFFPSTKTCSRCNQKNDSMTLADRTFICPSCLYVQDRDVNAAINLKQLAASLSESVNACGEIVNPALVG
ncbi:MAG: transposase [Candidatus Poribacteria bacterium]|nr:transposase [Candidatus Poribacteria bacterium]